MGSSIIKLLTGVLAFMFASRFIGMVIAIIAGFLFYKYLTDPKYIPEKIEYFKKTYQNSINKNDKKEDNNNEARILLIINA